jgi:hypothetical protein
MVIVLPEAKGVGYRMEAKEHVIRVVCCVADTGSASHTGVSNITEYSGVTRSETLRKYVENVIAGIDIGNAEMARIEVEYDPTELFPMFWVSMLVTIIEEHTLGCDPLE